jgi:hypothetical protein
MYVAVFGDVVGNTVVSHCNKQIMSDSLEPYFDMSAFVSMKEGT